MEHLADVLRQLFVLLLAAKAGDEIFKRIGQPTLVGEILGGVVVGPSVLTWYTGTSETQLFAEIGVVLLLFQVGIETRLGELLRVGVTASAVAGLGVGVPLAGGFGLGVLLGYPYPVAAFIGAAMVATSVGVTARTMRAIGILDSLPGRVVIGAAVVDDVLAILILAIAVGLAEGGLDAAQLALLVLVAVGFIAAVGVGGTRLLSRRRSLLTEPRFAETPFLPGMLLMLGLATLSAAIGLAAIIGAFLAGMVAGESSERQALEIEVAPVAAFFTPFFFGAIGAQLDLAALFDPAWLAPLLLVCVVAILTKALGAFVGSMGLGVAAASLVGVSMVPRGEVGIVVAGLGLQLEALEPGLYAALVAMAVVTTMVVPPVLPWLAKRAGLYEPRPLDERPRLGRNNAG
jgi:Kef-type K+ transport system membrane component KefB